ncbi:hypothetical protein ABIE89_004973 [Bradyrhizobium niftali]
MWNRSDAKYLSRMNDLATPRSNSTAREQYAKVRARISKADIANLKEYHKALVAAERGSRRREAVQVNWQFHYTLYKAANAPELLETIWLRNGPLLNMLYPHATPTYPGRHQHLSVLDGYCEESPGRETVHQGRSDGGRRQIAAVASGYRSRCDALEAGCRYDVAGNVGYYGATEALGWSGQSSSSEYGRRDLSKDSAKCANLVRTRMRLPRRQRRNCFNLDRGPLGGKESSAWSTARTQAVARSRMRPRLTGRSSPWTPSSDLTHPSTEMQRRAQLHGGQ